MARKLRSSHLLLAILAILAVALASVAYAAGGGQSGPDQFKLSNGGATVTDLTTGLVWQQTALNTEGFTEPEAASYCAALTLAKRHWRLPSIYELQRIVDYDYYNPTTAPVFGWVETSNYYLWSSTRLNEATWGSNYAGYGLLISFDIGDSRTFPVAQLGLGVRCVS
jgi:hypothetical protein